MLNKHKNSGLLFCAATLAVGLGACGEGGEGDPELLQSVDTPAVVDVDRDEDPSASPGKGGPAVVDVDRDEDPSASPGKGGPAVVGVTRDDDPSPSGGKLGGPSVGSVTRTVDPKPTPGIGGPRIIDVDRDESPDGKGGPSVTREPVVPGGPAVPGTDGPSAGATPRDGTFASVIANGTGCPAGTWNTAISGDGRTFTTTFTGYSAFVSPEQAISIKDCTLQIKVHTSDYLQYAVQGLEFFGYSYLEEGVTATVTAKTYFQGNPGDSVDTSSELKGYKNDLFVLRHGVDLGREAWSECGKERQINVQTRIRLRNADPAGTGFVNLSAAKGRAQVIVRGSVRRCSPDTSTPSKPDVSVERDPTPSAPSTPGISVERS